MREKGVRNRVPVCYSLEIKSLLTYIYLLSIAVSVQFYSKICGKTGNFLKGKPAVFNLSSSLPWYSLFFDTTKTGEHVGNIFTCF